MLRYLVLHLTISNKNPDREPGPCWLSASKSPPWPPLIYGSYWSHLQISYPLVMTNSWLLNMVIYSEFFHEKMWFSIVMLVYQRVKKNRSSTDHRQLTWFRIVSNHLFNSHDGSKRCWFLLMLTLIGGFCWWDPWSTINIAAPLGSVMGICFVFVFSFCKS